MELTESVVVQVAPDYENQKIQEMQRFRWNLQGRQEVHEKGEAFGRPSYVSDSYIVKTTVHHYVKLHFVRSLNLPNLDKIRKIEAELSSLPFPGPASMIGPGCFTAFFAIGVIPALMVMANGRAGEGLGLLCLYGAFVALGVYWLKSRMKKSAQAKNTCTESVARSQQLLAELQAL